MHDSSYNHINFYIKITSFIVKQKIEDCKNDILMLVSPTIQIIPPSKSILVLKSSRLQHCLHVYLVPQAWRLCAQFFLIFFLKEMKSRLVSQDLRDYSLQLCVDNTRFTLKKEKKIKIVQNKILKINSKSGLIYLQATTINK
jgi:hypothetical protein